MPWFDIVVLTILLTSGGIGFYQGAAREMVAVLSFLIAAVVAVATLRFTGPLGRNLIDPDWAGTAAAAIASFVMVYGLVRLTGAGIARRIQETEILGLLDRTVGLGFGLIRAFVMLGAFNLAFNAATPADLKPSWMTQAVFYPMTAAAGQVLKAFAPKGLDMANRLKPAVSEAVRDSSANAPRDSGDSRGYDARDRGGIDDLVEKTR